MRLCRLGLERRLPVLVDPLANGWVLQQLQKLLDLRRRRLLGRRGLGVSRGATGEVHVWALDMYTAKPLSGVDVKLVRASGHAVAECRTDGGKGCRLAPNADDPDRSPPIAVIASKGDDLTFLKFDELQTEIDAALVHGEPYTSHRNYRASMWSDRGVYRPGDTVHLAAVVRDNDFVAPDKGLPVELRVTDPRSREYRKVVLSTDAAGLVNLDIPLNAYAQTGRYQVAVNVADRTVGQYAFNVEEFVPERMKVEGDAMAPGYFAADAPEFNFRAKYLFGGTAEGNRVQMNCEYAPATFSPKKNANYEYGVWTAESNSRPVALGSVDGSLDKDGAIVLKCPNLEKARGLRGMGRVTANAAVFEAGSGRTTRGAARVAVHPEKYYIGLQSGVRKAAAGKAFEVSGIVVDWLGEPVGNVENVDIALYRIESEYNYEYDEQYGYERYVRRLRPVRESSQTVKVTDGRFKMNLTPGENAQGYLVRARSDGAETDLRIDGTWYYYWDWNNNSVDQTPRPLKPTTLAMELPDAVHTDAKNTVGFKIPYRGRMLVTVETDKLVAAEWLEVEAGEEEWSFSIDEFAPNVYVSALLIKDPHLDSKDAFLPDRAFGVASVRVEPVDFTDTVTLKVPDEIRSNSRLTVDVDLGRKVEEGTVVTIAAVDEGILSLTGFKDPDPFTDVFTRRSLGIQTYETVGWTLHLPPAGPSSSTGGDEEGELAAPERVQMAKPVALWSGVVPVEKDGKARVHFDVPQYRGSLRVMAVSAGPRRMGRAAASVPVRDPLVVQTTLPRFLTAGDEVEIPVFITNLSGQSQKVSVALEVEDMPLPGVYTLQEVLPVKLMGPAEKKLSLENAKSGTVVFKAVALKTVGAARFRVKATAGKLVSEESLEVPFEPAAPRTREVQRILIGNDKVDLKPYLKGWLPGTEQSTFWITANPYGESFDHLHYLIRYPHGCIEQTTSSMRPMLHVRNLLQHVDPQYASGKAIDVRVAAGIDRLLSMQTPSGGFGYWPGARTPHRWGTAYATHALFDARKVGFAVPESRLNNALDWLESEVGGRGSRNRQYSHFGGDPEYYMHYVLALAGRGYKARIQQLIDALSANPSGEEAERAYVLKAALHLAGDRTYERDLKTFDQTQISEYRSLGGNFYSDLRRRAFVFNIYQDLFGNADGGEAVAEQIAKQLGRKRSGYYTTQELVWSVTSLGRWVSGLGNKVGTPTLKANRKSIPWEKKGNDGPKGDDRAWTLARASEYGELSLEIDGRPDTPVYLFLSSEGIRGDAKWSVGGTGLKLTREYLDADGKTLDIATGIPLGQMVFTRIAIENTSNDQLENVALIDRFPAGWEIENPRLGRGQALNWLTPDRLWDADYMNLRDDRLEMFGGLKPGEKREVVYALRAVTAGRFTIPPVEAEAMYDARIWAREAGRRGAVTGPWGPYLED